MSDLATAADILQFASDIVGKTGPITLDTRVYAHNILLDEDRSSEDQIVLGEGGTAVTFATVIALFEQLNELVDELSDDSGRTYFFEGITKHSAAHFSLNWGS